MSVTLRKIENKDGTTSLYLDIYHNGKRSKEFLNECKQVKPSNPIDRKKNSENMSLAKKISIQRAQELQSNDYNLVAEHKSKVDVIHYFESYIKQYTKKDKRNMEGVCKHFKHFMNKEKIASLSMKQLSEDIVFNFSEYLKSVSEGEGAASYFARFKKMLKHAVREKVLLKSPADDITIKRDLSLTKDILTIEEIQKLAFTPISNMQVRNAFLFCCFSGLRWVDVEDLKWKHIDLNNQELSKVQAKTDIKVSVMLNKTAVSVLPEQGKPEDAVFMLPSHTGALKTLRNWVSKAGVQKHITWHCARHSFATNLIYYKTDIAIIANLLGHSGLKHVMRYTRVAEELKRKAVNNLPTIEI